MGTAWKRAALLAVLATAAAGCGRRYEGGGELRAQRVLLEREVEGLREAVTRLERGEPVFPLEDVAISIDESLLKSLIASELPLALDVDAFHLTLSEAEVGFDGAPTVRLRGGLTRPGTVDLEAAVTILGALDEIEVDHGSSALQAKIAVDHIDIEKAAGIEAILSGSTLDEIARTLRLAIADRLPSITIPVKLQEAIDLPAVTHGPVRVAGARMPIAASVDRVLAGSGRLWIAIRFQPGALVKTTDPPAARDLTAEEVGASLEPDGKEGR